MLQKQSEPRTTSVAPGHTMFTSTAGNESPLSVIQGGARSRDGAFWRYCMVLLLGHCQNWSHESAPEKGRETEKDPWEDDSIGYLTAQRPTPPEIPKLWVDFEMIPLMGSPHLSTWVRTRCRERIDDIKVSAPGSNCSYPCNGVRLWSSQHNLAIVA